MSESEENNNSLAAGTNARYVFKLFISGMSIKSVNAIENLREICEHYLPENFDIEIIDVYQQARMATDHQIIATPTLIKENPLPKKIILGDLSNKNKVLSALDITAK